jgi:hypothetical protein
MRRVLISRSRIRRRPFLAVPLLMAVASTSACAGTVPMEAAPAAFDTGCAEVVVRSPSDVIGLSARRTDAQGTGAWGEPAQILLRCGVPDPGPSAECITEGGVNWTIEDSGAGVVRATTYGRSPITEVIIDPGLSGGREILAALAPALSRVPALARCS